MSSNIIGGIKAVLFIYFFLRKDFTRTKSTKTHKKWQHFYALKKHLSGIKSLIRLFAFLCFSYAFCAFLCFFMCKTKQTAFLFAWKTSRRKKIACLRFCAFCAFYAHKKHLSESRLVCVCAFYASYAFWCFFVLFYAFLCV